MNTIEAEHIKDAKRGLHRAIEEWLKRNYNYKRNGVPSWRMLAKAVRDLDGTIFEKIVSGHQGTSKCSHIIYRISYTNNRGGWNRSHDQLTHRKIIGHRCPAKRRHK